MGNKEGLRSDQRFQAEVRSIKKTIAVCKRLKKPFSRTFIPVMQAQMFIDHGFKPTKRDERVSRKCSQVYYWGKICGVEIRSPVFPIVEHQ